LIKPMGSGVQDAKCKPPPPPKKIPISL
jgi:hypothetical protein